MKIRVISTALFCLVAGSALAGPPPGAPERNIERLTILLDLDAGQKVAVQKVLDEQHERMKSLRQQARPADKSSEARPTREERQTRHEQMRKDTQEKLRGILSDTQMKKFAVLTDRPEGHGPGRHGTRGDWSNDKAQ